jgi:predicted DNA-binding transcriptional regulator AlpA
LTHPLRRTLPLPDADPPAPAVTRAPLPIEPLLSVTDLARILAVSRRSLERLRAAGKLPRPDLHLGRSPRWRAETIRRWLDDSQT